MYIKNILRYHVINKPVQEYIIAKNVVDIVISLKC